MLIRVKTIPMKSGSCSVDTPEDLLRVKQMMFNDSLIVSIYIDYVLLLMGRQFRNYLWKHFKFINNFIGLERFILGCLISIADQYKR